MDRGGAEASVATPRMNRGTRRLDRSVALEGHLDRCGAETSVATPQVNLGARLPERLVLEGHVDRCGSETSVATPRMNLGTRQTDHSFMLVGHMDRGVALAASPCMNRGTRQFEHSVALEGHLDRCGAETSVATPQMNLGARRPISLCWRGMWTGVGLSSDHILA